MKRFTWLFLAVVLMPSPSPAGATSFYPFYNYETKTEFGRVFFASGSAELDDAAKRVLNRQFRVVVSFPTDYGIIIHGHTDHKEVPGGQESLALSEERAQTVKDYFISKGIAAKRIDIMSYGWYRPSVPTSGDWSKNRRTVTIDRQVQLLAPAWATSIDLFQDDRVFFASGSAKLDDAAKRVLDRQFRVVDSFPTELGLTISGHTEEKELPGRREAVALGERRAQAVKDYLVSKGLAPEQIDTVSQGWYESNISTSANLWKNRRAVTRARPLQ